MVVTLHRGRIATSIMDFFHGNIISKTGQCEAGPTFADSTLRRAGSFGVEKHHGASITAYQQIVAGVVDALELLTRKTTRGKFKLAIDAVHHQR